MMFIVVVAHAGRRMVQEFDDSAAAFANFGHAARDAFSRGVDAYLFENNRLRAYVLGSGHTLAAGQVDPSHSAGIAATNASVQRVVGSMQQRW